MSKDNAEQRRTNPEWLKKAFNEYREVVFREASRVPVGTQETWLLDFSYDEPTDRLTVDVRKVDA